MNSIKSIVYYNYEVYEDGKVFSYYTNKFLKGEITKFGYIQYSLYINRKIFRIKAHQLVGILFLEKPNEVNLCINHKDGNKLNNHFSNLEWCTYKENNKHARDMGLNNISKSNTERWKNDKFRKQTSKNISKGIL